MGGWDEGQTSEPHVHRLIIPQMEKDAIRHELCLDTGRTRGGGSPVLMVGLQLETVSHMWLFKCKEMEMK